MHRFVLTLAALAIGALPARAQNVLRVKDLTVEVLGLRRWTLPMLQDSLAKYAPADSLHTHGCAASLRYKLGFADAAAMEFRADSGRRHLVVAVIEPQDSARVRYRPAYFDTTGDRPEWRELISRFRTQRRPFLFAARTYPMHRVGHPEARTAVVAGADSLAVAETWALLARHATERDRQLAVAALRSDRNFRNRIVAAAVLANFARDDRTWHALVEALREEDGIVKGTAADVLLGMATASPRAVDWRPVSPSLRVMLHGTALFELPRLMQVLAATRVSPALAPQLVGRGGGEFALVLLGAQEPTIRRRTRQFFVALAGGRDQGDDPARWRAWAGRL